MQVSLIDHQVNALDLLLGTKNTRLGFGEDPSTWSAAKKEEHLSYMRDTIKSSWEFVNYTFEIEAVTRSFTHQLVRTRSGKFAQESQRTVDVRDHAVIKPESVQASAYASGIWDEAMEDLKDVYAFLVDHGIPVQDARDSLPTGMSTAIKCQFHLRAMHDMGKVRLCARTQGLYQDVFRQMRQLAIGVHPWVLEHRFIEVACVSDGICAFPRFGKKECKFYRPWMNLDTQKRAHFHDFWAEQKQVAIPVARDGKTM